MTANSRGQAIRSFWLELGWLVTLVITIAIPLGLDAVGALTYLTSLLFWLIPIVYLSWTFMTITAGGSGAAPQGAPDQRVHHRRARCRPGLSPRFQDASVPRLCAARLRGLRVVSSRRRGEDSRRGDSVLRVGTGRDDAGVCLRRREMAAVLQSRRRSAERPVVAGVVASRLPGRRR